MIFHEIYEYEAQIYLLLRYKFYRFSCTFFHANFILSWPVIVSLRILPQSAPSTNFVHATIPDSYTSYPITSWYFFVTCNLRSFDTGHYFYHRFYRIKIEVSGKLMIFRHK